MEEPDLTMTGFYEVLPRRDKYMDVLWGHVEKWWYFSGKNDLQLMYRGADKSLARPTSLCILFDGENVSFDASLVTYINSTNIPQIMIVNRIYEH
jgi:hypothetical protein